MGEPPLGCQVFAFVFEQLRNIKFCLECAKFPEQARIRNYMQDGLTAAMNPDLLMVLESM